jgi:hypothetical protein
MFVCLQGCFCTNILSFFILSAFMHTHLSFLWGQWLFYTRRRQSLGGAFILILTMTKRPCCHYGKRHGHDHEASEAPLAHLLSLAWISRLCRLTVLVCPWFCNINRHFVGFLCLVTDRLHGPCCPLAFVSSTLRHWHSLEYNMVSLL